MLEIKNVTKVYKTGDLVQVALDKVSVNFRESEFAAILGPSGSGKTTLLNIIGGLDHYDSGDLIINEVSTKKYKDANWDSYRNHRIGFVFQSYNLISHQTILQNVMLALTLSGISKEESLKRAKAALEEVGLGKQIHKRPNQMSGGQMQRVAIARALVNNPDILLADEPTGALDSETSVQIMDLLKKIAKNKLVIMVTHNPELAKEYANRIITLKDGKILDDTNKYDGKKNTKERETKDKSKKTSMKFWTALGLSFNNLMTKKARTILVALAGSIGIIGIALISAVSTGFQNYVDSISEDTLSSYPLTIMQESTDVTSLLLSLTSGGKENDGTDKVVEKQYISSMLASVKANDLKSFKKYLEKNYKDVEKDLTNVQYKYSVDPNIYTIDATNKIVKLNPSNMMASMMGGSSNSLLSSYSSFSSIYSQMVDNMDDIKKDYDVLSGKWPTKYNEMVLVLSEANSISDLLVYSLGLRDTEELTKMFTKIMSGEAVENTSDPMHFTYDDLLNTDLRLVLPADTYRFNSKYDVYEDMSSDEAFMKKVYNNATKLKIVGIVSPKEGASSMALSPGVAYRSDLIDYIIDNSKEKEIVQKQMKNTEVDIFSGQRFDSKKNKYNFEFTDLVSIDQEKLASAFNVKVDQKTIEEQTKNSMNEITNSITTDTTDAKNVFVNGFKDLANGLFDTINSEYYLNDINNLVDNYLSSAEAKTIIGNIESSYVIPSKILTDTYSGLLKTMLSAYITAYNAYEKNLDGSFVPDEENPKAEIINDVKTAVIDAIITDDSISVLVQQIATGMTEALMKKTILTKVGEITSNLTASLASGFKVDESKIASAFKLNFSEDELTRVVSAMVNQTESTAKSNLIALGYQDKDEPTYMAFYFDSFDAKEHFLSFIDKYNKKVDEDHEIKFTDTTGVLMSSVKTIVNAVSYVLIAFVSISLVVSSIMIGVITYISVYERTKEIGILRAIGASKGNISSIFNAETFIIGLLSGVFGIGIAYALIPIINAILHHYTGNIPLSASLAFSTAALLIVLSVILTLIGGLIPAKKASKKDPVIALRTE